MPSRPARLAAALAQPVNAVAILAAVSLALGLTLPVITVESFWFFDRASTLLGTGLKLLSRSEWGLGLLLLTFSVVLPPLKLAVVRFAPRDVVARWLGVLGHWSMLDVFVVAGVVAVMRTEVIADARPGPAVPFFTLGLLATAWLAHHREVPAGPVKGRYRLLSLALIVLGSALPLLHVERWFFLERSPSLLEIVAVLAANGGSLTALLLAGFVLVLPLIAAAAGSGLPIPARLVDFAHRWEMLPVFAGATLVLAAKLAIDGAGGVGGGWWCLVAAAVAGRVRFPKRGGSAQP